VTFVGGEPALDGRLEGFVTRARELGFARIGVQTNGWALAEAGRVETVARAGLTDVHLSIHGAEARVHDWHVGRAGAFDAAMRTLSAARSASLEVVVATVLTRSTFRGLAPMPRMLASRGAAAWCIEVPRWRGDAATASDRVVPRLALALPFALHAIDAAEALGLPAFVRGAPSCLLGPWASRALEGDTRAYGAACSECASRVACAGVDAEYLARFGDGEITACALVGGDDRYAEVRAMFVGLGEVAPPSPVVVAPSPQRARVALPLLGRPAPGKGEVTASSPKQTGDALRAIFPGLFEGEPTPRKE
jgi:MoaA/NifB/PqqE/SkfB family radical SAM enzyme